MLGLAAFHIIDEVQLWFFRLEYEEPGLTWDQIESNLTAF